MCANTVDAKSPSRPGVIVGISGASGAVYGVRILHALRTLDITTHLIITRPGQQTLALETQLPLAEITTLATHTYAPDNLMAPVAGGSFPTTGMVIAPCSMKTLSAVAHSHSDNLLTRAADVTLKEGRTLILVVRETPLHLGHLRLMVQAAEIGAVIFPPVPAFYTHPQSLEEMIDQTVGRILARLGVPNQLYPSWNPPAAR